MRRELYYFYVNHLTHFSIEKIHRMLSLTGDPEELFSLSADDLRDYDIPITFPEESQMLTFRDEKKLESLWREMEDKSISYVHVDMPEFPDLLREIPDCPTGLFYRGKLPSEKRPKVAIVGSRQCSSYGREMAYFLGSSFASHGVEVISGMALGIDGFAGRGSLTGDHTAYAVLAGGLNIPYPRDNMDLFMQLVENGGVLSERPLNHPYLPAEFHYRNRLISGLADAVVVVESRKRSGTSITVNYALSQNRDVFALPGRVGDPLAEGTNELIKSGANILTCPEDVLAFLGVPVKEDTVKVPEAVLSPREEAVVRYISADTVSVEELLQKTGLTPGLLLEILVELEIKGVISSELGGYRKKPCHIVKKSV